jgi:hypothetical protein
MTPTIILNKIIWSIAVKCHEIEEETMSCKYFTSKMYLRMKEKAE